MSDLLGDGCSWVPVGIGTSDPNMGRCEGSAQKQCLVVADRALCPWAVFLCKIQQVLLFPEHREHLRLWSVRGKVSLLMGRHQSMEAGEIQGETVVWEWPGLPVGVDSAW